MNIRYPLSCLLLTNLLSFFAAAAQNFHVSLDQENKTTLGPQIAKEVLQDLVDFKENEGRAPKFIARFFKEVELASFEVMPISEWQIAIINRMLASMQAMSNTIITIHPCQDYLEIEMVISDGVTLAVELMLLDQSV